MRSIYQIEHKETQKQETQTKKSYSPRKVEFMDIKDFFIFMKMNKMGF